MIQKELGAEALSYTCASFPRFFNSFGEQKECGLTVSCPEAARLILLHPEPITFNMDVPDSEFLRRDNFNFKLLINTADGSFLNNFRTLILHILKFRQLTLGARMMTLGLLLDEVNTAVSKPSFKHYSEISPVLSNISAMLADSSSITKKFELISSDLPRKLDITTSFLADFFHKAEPRLKECILAFIEGISIGEFSAVGDNSNPMFGRYQHAYETYYMDYFRDKGYILENYLVNQVFINLFPFLRGSYLDLYRAMVFNLVIIQVLLVGMSAHFKGLNDALVVQLIQSFSRRSALTVVI